MRLRVGINLEGILDDFSFDIEDQSRKTSIISFVDNKENTKTEEINTEEIVKQASFESFIPEDLTILGLDISKSSTGWCLIENQKKTTGNLTLSGYLAKKNPDFKELMYRVELKEKLAERFKGYTFDHIMIEDVFQGANAKTVRLLYDINTAIDELIYEGIIICKHFHRISNQTWKGWLYKIDSNNTTKAMTDKPRIQACMAMLGVTEEGDGFQDRLDATGLIAGYFINEKSIIKKERKQKLSFSDIGMRYRHDKEDALQIRNNVVKLSDGPIEINENAITTKIIEKYCLRNPDGVYITKNRISLGFLGQNKKIEAIEGGGYLAFWIKPAKRIKYLKKC